MKKITPLITSVLIGTLTLIILSVSFITQTSAQIIQEVEKKDTTHLSEISVNPLITLSGSVSLQERRGTSTWGTLYFFAPGASDPFKTKTVKIKRDGTFSTTLQIEETITETEEDVVEEKEQKGETEESENKEEEEEEKAQENLYDIGIKVRPYLSTIIENVSLISGETTHVEFGELLIGDVEKSDFIGLADFGYAAYFARNPVIRFIHGIWFTDADLNLDHVIDQKDIDLMVENYGKIGDIYLRTERN